MSDQTCYAILAGAAAVGAVWFLMFLYAIGVIVTDRVPDPGKWFTRAWVAMTILALLAATMAPICGIELDTP